MWPTFEFIQEIKPGSYDAHSFTSEHSYLNYIALYQFAVNYCGGKNVLDAACGLGYGSYLLAHKAMHVTGLEIVDSNIEFAQENYKKDNLQFVVQDATQMEYEDNTFDTIVSIETFEHVPPELARKFIAEFKRVLKTDGKLVISTPNTDVYRQISKTPDHVNELSVDDFYKVLSAEFKTCTPFYQRKGVLESTGKYYSTVQKDKLGLRKLIPTGLKNRLRKMAAPQLHKDPEEILQEVQVHQAKDKDDVKDAVIQAWVTTNKKIKF
jgi:ubiquinone/menaquinone biosynthesis C-methylase UbiE